jgi:hypothetical protein
MKSIKIILTLFLLIGFLDVSGQNIEQKYLKRSNLKKVEGVWYGSSEKGDSLQMELNFTQIYYEKGNYLVDQLAGGMFLKKSNTSETVKVVRIDAVEISNQNEYFFLRFKGFDLLKEKPVQILMKILSLESLSAEIEVKNKETWVLNGKVEGRSWDPGFSINSYWKLNKK